MLASGSSAIIPHLQNVKEEAVSIAVTVIATVALLTNVIQAVYSFDKKSGEEVNASLQLREMGKRVRLEVTKGVGSRWADPFTKMLELEEKLSEIMHNVSPKIVNTKDIRERIRKSRRLRLRKA